MLFCIKLHGKGANLKKYKALSSKFCEKLTSYVRISTCERIELYSDLPLEAVDGMASLEYPASLINLTEIMSGAQSGLFGELEISEQIMSSLEAAKTEKHLSKNLESMFIKAYAVSKIIRAKFELNSSWTQEVIKKVGTKDSIYIQGNGELAKSLKSHFGDNLLQKTVETSNVIIVLRRGFSLDGVSNDAMIINLTDEPISDKEISMYHLFKKPSKELLFAVKEEIKSNLD